MRFRTSCTDVRLLPQHENLASVLPGAARRHPYLRTLAVQKARMAPRSTSTFILSFLSTYVHLPSYKTFVLHAAARRRASSRLSAATRTSIEFFNFKCRPTQFTVHGHWLLHFPILWRLKRC
ncbi:hypothetical protein GALMADRAFT_1209268 [Galerina marginata CBS 339.88]|uniref:Uncharacterized protein n=1 Tax=Galerina marginata (strain CBS 339.88) TaxID=685588 RepID=A0A067SH84_GALM3|nr:hypothetical protein GALMADRAFT_1209268 [Galerina marginata CBS 339.88]